MSGQGHTERNLPLFSGNSFGPLDHFKVDCMAEELAQGLHLVSLMKDVSLEKGSPTSSVPRVCYEPPTSSTSEVGLLLPWWMWCVLQLLCSMFALFLPRRRLCNLYSLVGIQHCSCLPLVLITETRPKNVRQKLNVSSVEKATHTKDAQIEKESNQSVLTVRKTCR